MSLYLTALCLGALVTLMAPNPARRRNPFVPRPQDDDLGVQLRCARLEFGLSLVEDLSAAQVESAYRHKAIETHPDGRGEDGAAFAALTEQKHLLLEHTEAAAVQLTAAEKAQKIKFDTVVAKYGGHLCADLQACDLCSGWLMCRAATCAGCTLSGTHTCGLSRGFLLIKTLSKKTAVLTLIAHTNVTYDDALTEFETEERLRNAQEDEELIQDQQEEAQLNILRKSLREAKIKAEELALRQRIRQGFESKQTEEIRALETSARQQQSLADFSPARALKRSFSDASAPVAASRVASPGAPQRALETPGLAVAPKISCVMANCVGHMVPRSAVYRPCYGCSTSFATNCIGGMSNDRYEAAVAVKRSQSPAATRHAAGVDASLGSAAVVSDDDAFISSSPGFI